MVSAVASAAACVEDTVWIRGAFGEARFAVELADDPQERAMGLMHRPSMPMSAGMLFIYPAPQRLSFWMRNTLIELDMLFVDATGVVRNIHHRAQPLDETPIEGGQGLTHVLEINGGLARQLGLEVGDQLRHPSFRQARAAWPC
ncbi:DUF192 domain-containing protein [uncultured Tateyamaria sp.]|uniref:DUF192 domain-containing protein n=1 Tax=Tateyamaria sp. 1078 TaxID=3417464 RepID=UPI002608CB27|nr:DUF192 domain-containing protein [uncultured Tateyamaria sp.]